MNPNHPLTLGLLIINSGIGLDNKCKFQKILHIPPYRCKGKNCKGKVGFKISLGINKNIDLSVNLLESVYDYVTSNSKKVFDHDVFQSKYYDYYKTNSSYFYIIGKMIVKAGFGIRIRRDKYKFH
jgi:hypothetical protein